MGMRPSVRLHLYSRCSDQRKLWDVTCCKPGAWNRVDQNTVYNCFAYCQLFSALAVPGRFKLKKDVRVTCKNEQGRGQLSGQSAGLVIERSRVQIPAGAAEFSFPG